MQNENGHLSTQQILLLLDGELGGAELLHAEEHLEICAACRKLMVETQATLEDLKEIHLRQSLGPSSPPPSIDGPRALLKARLHEMQQQTKRRAPMWSSLLYAAAIFLAVGVGIVLVHRREAHQPMEYRAILDRPVPNASLTPGAVRKIDIAEVCPAIDDDLDPPVPEPVKQAVFAEYNIPEQERGREFQVDYLINPQLGGTAEINNLWPQPYSSTEWNAHTKDALEERLHTMVCAGQISLPQAQHALAGDWIAAYQEYFHTSSPLVSEAGIADLPQRLDFLTSAP